MGIFYKQIQFFYKGKRCIKKKKTLSNKRAYIGISGKKSVKMKFRSVK